jgi:GNAT superfamily N-acetyltransferase
MTDWQIRSMELGDVPAAIAVGQMSYGDEVVPLFNTNIESDLLDAFSTAAKRPTYFVAEHDGAPIGFAGWCRSYLTWKVAVFSYCHILPTWQRLGLGRAFVETRLMDIHNRAPEITMILVNTWATDIYRRYGFKSLVFDDEAFDEGHLMKMMLAQ